MQETRLSVRFRGASPSLDDSGTGYSRMSVALTVFRLKRKQLSARWQTKTMNLRQLYKYSKRSTPMLRHYQSRAIEQARASGSRSILLVAPTGAGKTRTAVEFCRRKRTLWLAHRTELVTQAYDHLKREGVEDVGVITARSSSPDRVTVASIQTLLARGLRPVADVVVLDEAHHFPSAKWRELALGYYDSVRIGLTATPERADGTPLGDIFDTLITVASVRELIDAGFLVEPEVISGPHRAKKALFREPWTVFKPKRATIIFAPTVSYAEEIHTRIGGAVVTGSTPHAVRADAISRFRSGSLNPLINVNCLTEGFDAPNAEVCILARACHSPALYLQIIGRVLRPAPGKTKATIFDLSGAVHDHGLPDADRVYSLDGEAIRLTAGAPSVWQCPQCGHVYASPGCKDCGFIPQPEVPKITPEELRRIAASHTPEQRAAYYIKLSERAREKNYRAGWVDYMFKARYGRWPTAEEKRHAARISASA